MEFSSERGRILFKTIGHCFNLWDPSFQRKEKQDSVLSFFVEFQVNFSALFSGHINTHHLLQSIWWIFPMVVQCCLYNAFTMFAITTLIVNLTVNKSFLRGEGDRNIPHWLRFCGDLTVFSSFFKFNHSNTEYLK